MTTPYIPLTMTENLLLPFNGRLNLRDAYGWKRSQVSFFLTYTLPAFFGRAVPEKLCLIFDLTAKVAYTFLAYLSSRTRSVRTRGSNAIQKLHCPARFRADLGYSRRLLLTLLRGSGGRPLVVLWVFRGCRFRNWCWLLYPTRSNCIWQ